MVLGLYKASISTWLRYFYGPLRVCVTGQLWISTPTINQRVAVCQMSGRLKLWVTCPL
uniref:Uncharacterized protein n=1 Tax=Leersia perrieri TaxID=77586 RepID=A0A0D9VW50_9ORYZ